MQNLPQGLFVTGADISEKVPSKKSLQNLDTKTDIKRITSQSVQNKNKTTIQLPQVPQSTRNDSKSKIIRKDNSKPLLRVSTSEKEFRNPLLKKLDHLSQKHIKEVERRKEIEKKKAQDSMMRGKEKYDDENTLRRTFDFVDAFEETIGEDYKNIYEFKEADKFGNIQKKKHFIQSIEKQQAKLGQDKKRHDSIKYDILQKQRILDGLQKKKREYAMQLEDNDMMKQLRNTMIHDIVEKDNSTNKECYEIECRQHMIGVKKHDLLCMAKRIAYQKKVLAQRNFTFEKRKKEIILAKEAGDRINFQKIKAEEKNKFVGERFDPDFEELLNDEVSEFEDKRRLQQIMDHEKILELNKEKKRRDEYDRKLSEYRNKQQQYEAERQQHKIKYLSQKEEDVQHAKDLIFLTGAEISDQYQLKKEDPFNDMKKLREDLIKHLNQLEQVSREIAEMEQNRENEEIEYDRLKQEKKFALEELEKARFEVERLKKIDIYEMNAMNEEEEEATKKASKTQKTQPKNKQSSKKGQDRKELVDQQLKRQEIEELMKFHKDLGMDELENMLIKQKNECKRIDDEVKRINKTLYEAFTSISRIMCQIQKKKVLDPIDSKDVDKVLSICGLKLERMLTLVIKKRRTFFMESINTDGTIREGSENYPPPYMGPIYDNHAKKKKMWERDDGEELSDSDFEQHREELQVQVMLNNNTTTLETEKKPRDKKKMQSGEFSGGFEREKY